MDENLTDVLSLELPCDRSAPSRVRRAISCAEPLDEVRDDAKLIASELVSSAVVQAEGRPGKAIKVRVSSGPGRVLISVSRRVAEPGVLVEEDGPLGPGARVVKRLARRWGVERLENYRVWAELAARPTA